MNIAVYIKESTTDIAFVQLYDNVKAGSIVDLDGYSEKILNPSNIFASDGKTVIDVDVFLNNFSKFNCTFSGVSCTCVQKSGTTLSGRVLTTLTDTTTPLTLGRANTVQYLGRL